MSPSPSTPPIRVGLMGYGFSTKSFHLPFIQPNKHLEIYAFLQRAAAPAAPVAAEEDKDDDDDDDKATSIKPGTHCTIDYPHAKHYRTADDFFADEQIDLVVVCTKHDTHAEFAERALRSGKHVVVEKPFTVSVEEADRLIAAAKSGSGKILTVFQNRRYDSDFRTLKQLLDNRVLGTITEAELHYDVDFPFWMDSWNSPGWSPGDGMMYGLGSHTIDQALLLFGRPKSVTAFYRSLRGIKSETDDSFTIILQYDSNLIVTVKTTVVATMQQPLKYFVRGYDGTFIKYGEDVQESQISKGLTVESEGFGIEPEETLGMLTTKKQVETTQREVAGKWIGVVKGLPGDYAGFYRDLVNAIKGEGDLVVKPEESRDGLRIIELARKSADEGRTLPFAAST